MNNIDQSIEFNSDLIRRYDIAGPRYTSYPTAIQFHENFGEKEYRKFSQRSNEGEHHKPLSLYFHIPFCDTVCYYCGCNKIVTKNRQKAVPYLDHLYHEIAMQGELFDSGRPISQLHWGGGTPTFLDETQIAGLMEKTREHFSLLDDDQGEYSIEIDPREVSAEKVQLLRKVGFNRMSLGVQDFDSKVQKAVNRIQSEEETTEVMEAAKEAGFRSVSLDLIYGLPFQTAESFGKTLDKVIATAPDRLSVFNYAHLPEMFKPQRRINEDDLPSPAEKLDILQHTIEQLTAAGYIYVGMDHFARPDDELAIAQRNRLLYRNFQGYSTHADCDLVAMGVTSISMVGNSYSQNTKSADEYYALLDQEKIPVFRGVELSEDDLLRRDVINKLMCHFVLKISEIEDQYKIVFSEYFEKELKNLVEMENDGLIESDTSTINVNPVGRLLIRNICMVFDRYLREATSQRFSRVI